MEHNQLCFVNRLHQIIGTQLWKIQVDQEIETGHPVKTWRRYYPHVIQEINQQRLIKVDPSILSKKN